MGSAQPCSSQVPFQQALPSSLSVVQGGDCISMLQVRGFWRCHFCIQLTAYFLPPLPVSSLAQPISHVTQDNAGSRALQCQSSRLGAFGEPGFVAPSAGARGGGCSKAFAVHQHSPSPSPHHHICDLKHSLGSHRDYRA